MAAKSAPEPFVWQGYRFQWIAHTEGKGRSQRVVKAFRVTDASSNVLVGWFDTVKDGKLAIVELTSLEVRETIQPMEECLRLVATQTVAFREAYARLRKMLASL